ncbi:MAG: metallophosphoesterase family protein [Fimbriiglobus sp.]
MKRLALFGAVSLLLVTAALLSNARQGESDASSKPSFALQVEAKNPWTTLTPNTDPDQFQFAVVSDRTGGHRKGVFSKAVKQINLVQPEFIMSVGDLIEGSNDKDKMTKEWETFDSYVKQFQMPFFYCAGNHDAASKLKTELWTERLGKTYYHFLYKNCLFVVLNSNDLEPNADGKPGFGTRIGKTQNEWLAKVVKDNANVRWTFVFLHHPVWTARDLTTNGWLDVETTLAGRKHNIYCGHVHTYRKFLRNGTTYYQLATTGGGSAMRGVEYGEFDQIAWLTMKKEGPVMANILMSGLYNDELKEFESDEDGSVPLISNFPTVTGTVKQNGQAPVGVNIVFTPIPGEGKEEPKKEAPKVEGKEPKEPRSFAVTGSSKVFADGTFNIYSNRGAQGLRPGRYAVTFTQTEPFTIDPKAETKEISVPTKYRALNTTPLRVEVTKDGQNKFEFVLE